MKNKSGNEIFLKNYFFGSGDRYIVQTWEEELLDDGSYGPRLFRSHTCSLPDKKSKQWMNFGVWSHLKGVPHGFRESPMVPGPVVDIDRHNNEPMQEHTDRVMKAVHTLYRLSIRFCAEINPINGSTKLFCFGYKPIPLDRAKKWAQTIKEGLEFNCEIFPLNMKAVWLPLRPDKTTIIDTGIAPKEIRRRKNGDHFEKFETYSATDFSDWIKQGKTCCLSTILDELAKVVVQGNQTPCVVSQRSYTEFRPVAVQQRSIAVQQRSISGNNNQPSGYNAFTSQLDALLKYSRKLKRVPEIDQALEYLHQNGIYSGDWEEGFNRRTKRVEWLLSHISQTFDPNQCGENKFSLPLERFKNWARVNKIIGISKEFVASALAIVDYCCRIDPNEDGTLPTARARSIWDMLYSLGKVKTAWNDKKWKVVRDRLVAMGEVWVNGVWQIGKKAMVWMLGSMFMGKQTKKYNELPKRKSTLAELMQVIDSLPLSYLTLYRKEIPNPKFEGQIIEEKDDIPPDKKGGLCPMN
jgi:hypothetical protein